MDLRVVGFSGTPVSEGAGLKPPVYRHEASTLSFTGDPDAPTVPDLRDEAQTRADEQRGLVSLTIAIWERQPGSVFLYAHPLFLDPGPEGKKLDPSLLEKDDRLGVWLQYVERDQTLRRLLQ